MPAGRKSLKDELQIIRRYSELTPAYFRILKTALKSKNVEDQKWAVERLDKAFVKMIPQEVDARVITISQILNSLENGTDGQSPEDEGLEDSSSLQDQGQELEATNLQTEPSAGAFQSEQSQPESDSQE